MKNVFAMTSVITTSCLRCGQSCGPGENENPEARPFRRSEKGLCADCVVTQFLIGLEPLRKGLMENELEVLRDPVIQKQFAEILRVGRSELSADDIDWETVINQWELPFPRGG